MQADITVQYRGFIAKAVNARMREIRPGMCIDRDDLESEAYLGLLKAQERYDGKQAQFLTYAHHTVKGELQHAIRDAKPIPAWIDEVCTKLARAEQTLCARYGRMPTAGELIADTGISRSTYETARTAYRFANPVSLDAPLRDDENDDTSLRKEVPDTADMPDVQALARADADTLWSMVDTLTQMQATVIRMHYQDDLNQSQIARKLGISNNYVSYLLTTGCRKLRAKFAFQAARERIVC